MISFHSQITVFEVKMCFQVHQTYCKHPTTGCKGLHQLVTSLFLLTLLELLSCVLLLKLFIEALSLLSVSAVRLVIAEPDSISLLALFSVSVLSRMYS